jgi:hypothetical protein
LLNNRVGFFVPLMAGVQQPRRLPKLRLKFDDMVTVQRRRSGNMRRRRRIGFPKIPRFGL